MSEVHRDLTRARFLLQASLPVKRDCSILEIDISQLDPQGLVYPAAGVQHKPGDHAFLLLELLDHLHNLIDGRDLFGLWRRLLDLRQQRNNSGQDFPACPVISFVYDTVVLQELQKFDDRRADIHAVLPLDHTRSAVH